MCYSRGIINKLINCYIYILLFNPVRYHKEKYQSPQTNTHCYVEIKNMKNKTRTILLMLDIDVFIFEKLLLIEFSFLISEWSISDCLRLCNENPNCVAWSQMKANCHICDNRTNSQGVIDEPLRQNFYVWKQHLMDLTVGS